MSSQTTPQQGSTPAAQQQQGQSTPAPQQSGSGTPAKPQIRDWASI